MAATERRVDGASSNFQQRHNQLFPKFRSFNCLIIVIASILVYRVVLIQSYVNETIGEAPAPPSTKLSTASNLDESAHLVTNITNEVDVDGFNEKRTTIKKTATTTTTTANALKSAKKQQEQEQQATAATVKNKYRTLELVAAAAAAANKSRLACEYDKTSAQWGECEPNGSQRKVMKLRIGGGPDCKATKTIRRDCEAAWSECLNGFRTRLLTLDESIGSGTGSALFADSNDSNNGRQLAASNQPVAVAQQPDQIGAPAAERLRDTARPSDVAGLRSNIESESKKTTTTSGSSSGSFNGNHLAPLQSAPAAVVVSSSSPPPPLSSSSSSTAAAAALLSSRTCARHKLIKRECRQPGVPAGTTPPPSQTSGGGTGLVAATVTNGPRREQRLNSNANNMTPAQRRRFKQIQLKQQQQQQQREKHELLPNIMKPNTDSGPYVAPTSTTIAPPSSTLSANKRSGRSRR